MTVGTANYGLRVRLGVQPFLGRKSQLTYLHRPHCAPVASPSCPPPFLCCLCRNLTNLHAPENSIQVGEWKVARAALNRLLDMEKLQPNGAGRSNKGKGRRGSELAGGEMTACDWRVNNADWWEHFNWTELSCSEIECRQLNEQRRCQEIRSKKSNSEQKLCADPKKAAWILEKPINQAKSSQFNIVKVEQQLLKNC